MAVCPGGAESRAQDVASGMVGDSWFGATPLPSRAENVWESAGSKSAGIVPSETHKAGAILADANLPRSRRLVSRRDASMSPAPFARKGASVVCRLPSTSRPGSLGQVLPRAR